MFDFVFGGKRKLELIRELLEQRMREEGFDDMGSRLQVKELGRLHLLGTPEGALVTIVETVVKGQKQGMLLRQVLTSIEDHRRSLGSDPQEFAEIVTIASGPQAGESVGLYCQYRINTEHPSLISSSQFIKAFEQCAQEIATW